MTKHQIPMTNTNHASRAALPLLIAHWCSVIFGLLLLTAPTWAADANRLSHLVILYTNDIHGGLVPSDGFWLNRDFPPPIGNAPAAAAVIAEHRAEARKLGHDFLYVDLGDLFSGTPIGEFSRGQAVIDYLNYTGCDMFVPGNHEFDVGMKAFKDIVKRARAPFLCANIIKQGTDTLWPLMLPDTIIRLAGVKVGFFGLLTHYMKWTAIDSTFGPLDVQKHYVAAAREVQSLKSRGADIIIALTHIGYRHDRNLADSVPGIDVIIGGHSHTGLREPVEFERFHTICVQSYGRLTSVGRLDLTIDRETRRIADYDGELIELSAEEIAPDTAMQRIVEGWRGKAEVGFDDVIGTTKRRLTRGGDESPMGNLVVDAMREAFGTDIGVHMGVRGELKHGDVTYRDIHGVDPFGNTAVTMTMTGQQVWDMFEIGVNGHHAIFQPSGARIVYNPRKPAGQRLISVEVNGKPLDRTRDYTVATNSYLAAGVGEYGVFTQARDIEDTYTELRKILADHIKAHSPVDARVEGRIQTREK